MKIGNACFINFLSLWTVTEIVNKSFQLLLLPLLMGRHQPFHYLAVLEVSEIIHEWYENFNFVIRECSS